MAPKAIRVLLIEDDQEDILLITDMLQNTQNNFKVSICSHLKEAKKVLLKNVYDAILVDLNLPDSQGFETIQSLQKVAPDIPLIVISVVDDPDLTAQILSSGAQDYLPKQLIPADFIERIIVHSLERHKLYKTIEMNEKFTTQILDAILDGVLVLNAKNEILFQNRAAKTFLEHGLLQSEQWAFVRDKNQTKVREIVLKDSEGRALYVRARKDTLKWQGTPAFLFTLSDITQRKRYEQELSHKQSLLEVISQIARQLLRWRNWHNYIDPILGQIGSITRVDRVYLFQNYQDDKGCLHACQKNEWVAPGIQAQIQNPELEDIPLTEAGFGRWIEKLSKGQQIYGNVAEFPPSERKILEEQDIKSLLVTPIFVDEQWWGFLGFDSCLELREWTTSEREALQLAADIIGAAVQRQHNEEKMLKNAGKFQRFIDVATLGILLIKQERIIFANSTMVDIMKMTSEAELVGKTFMEFIHAEDLLEVEKHIAKMFKTAGKSQEFEFRLLRPDQTVAMVEGLASYMEDERETFLVFVKDISDRKKAELELKKTYQVLDRVLQTNTTVLFSGPLIDEFAPDYVSHNIKGLTGYEAREFIENPQIFYEALHPEDRAKVLKSMAQLKKTGSFSVEYRFKHKKGHFIWIYDERTVVKREDAQPEINGFWLDISLKKKFEQQYSRAQRLESLGTLAGGIAHDLNNVLTPILMGTELLKHIVKDEKARKSLELMETSAQRGALLIKQVLSFARGTEGERTVVQIRYVLSEVLKMVEKTFPRHIQLQVDVAADLWPVMADTSQLHQVIMNLLVNARDAMPEGGNLRISAENLMLDEQYAQSMRNAQEGPYVMVTISDSGMGIPEDQIDKIFDPFFTTKEVGKGTGMGLATVHRIVDEHGGFINVYSDRGKGTTFKIYFPALRAKKAKPRIEQEAVPLGNGQCILLIEDEVSVREITQKTLESNGYNVLAAADGPEGIALFAENLNTVEIIITDMSMPLMDGPSVIRALRRIDENVKIMAISGHDDDIGNLRLLNVPFVHKPFTATKLLKSVHQLLMQGESH